MHDIYAKQMQDWEDWQDRFEHKVVKPMRFEDFKQQEQNETQPKPWED